MLTTMKKRVSISSLTKFMKEEKNDSERVLLDATRAYPCFRPHADAHYYPQEGCTVAVQMRPPGGEGLSLIHI